MDWFVLRTKSRQEKALASSLEQLHIDYYLPLVRKTSYYGRRKVSCEVPLFSGYLFLKGSCDDAYSADRTKRVAQIIPVVDQERIEWELSNIREALQSEAPLSRCAYLSEGARVRVRAGPFKGLEGMVQRGKKADRLVLQVDAFGGAASLEVDGSLLESID